MRPARITTAKRAATSSKQVEPETSFVVLAGFRMPFFKALILQQTEYYFSRQVPMKNSGKVFIQVRFAQYTIKTVIAVIGHHRVIGITT